jgi:predicted GNAT family acetyltransferase
MAAGRLEMDEGGDIVFADYRLDGSRLIVDYVEAPRSLRGTGAAGRFMEGLAQFARSEGLKIVPICGYAAHWLHTSAKHRDLIAG